MEAQLWIGPAIVAALISGIVTIGSWVVGSARERRLQAALREERVRDVQTALLADVRSYRHRYFAVDLDALRKDVVDRIAAAPAEAPFTPFVPRDHGSLLWASIAREVHILPTEVIDPVVLFFSQLETISALIDDLRSDRYWSLGQSRRAAMYTDYIELRRFSVQLAHDAERALQAGLRLPALNNSAQAPSDPRSASAVSAASADVEKG